MMMMIPFLLISENKFRLSIAHKPNLESPRD
ncbi:hypothetical protein CIPAW_06G022800 [Carya illinoinensis]|uniref:Uncharacterized protein n=1 Tax=Carya illinoinensis TaxID=32201 RepID=A0A8T1Q011_CARIL|nr:hypothetical protein CIPAW_06G022800 [Carya illinoinensis]